MVEIGTVIETDVSKIKCAAMAGLRYRRKQKRNPKRSLLFWQLLFSGFALVRLALKQVRPPAYQAIQEQYAIQVINFVLDGTGLVTLAVVML